MDTLLYTKHEIPEAPKCRYCQPVGFAGGVWYEPCEDHEPKEQS